MYNPFSRLSASHRFLICTTSLTFLWAFLAQKLRQKSELVFPTVFVVLPQENCLAMALLSGRAGDLLSDSREYIHPWIKNTRSPSKMKKKILFTIFQS